MLVLTRREGQGVTITTPSGEVIVVWFNGAEGNRTVIGFEADPEVVIMRNELLAPPNRAA